MNVLISFCGQPGRRQSCRRVSRMLFGGGSSEATLSAPNWSEQLARVFQVPRLAFAALAAVVIVGGGFGALAECRPANVRRGITT